MQIYAAQALADVEEARSALSSGNSVQVDISLDKVRILVELIRSRMPAAEFHAMLRAVRALMDFQDNSQVLPLFPKLFYALDDIPPGANVKHARADLKKAENALHKPNRAEALRDLDKADADFTDPVLTPPLNATAHDLNAVLTTLAGNPNQLTDPVLKKLANDLMDLHKALATYPLDMSSDASPNQN